MRDYSVLGCKVSVDSLSLFQVQHGRFLLESLGAKTRLSSASAVPSFPFRRSQTPVSDSLTLLDRFRSSTIALLPEVIAILLLCALDRILCRRSWERRGEKPLRAIHDDLHIIHKAVDHFEYFQSYSTFLLCETVEPLQDSLDLALSQQLLCEFLCAVFGYRILKTKTQLLNLPSFICLVARARTESNSVVIFTLIPESKGDWSKFEGL